MLTNQRAGLGESPLWHGSQRAFYWVDINADTVFKLDPVTSQVQTVFEGRKVTALSETDTGGLVMTTSRALLTFEDGEAEDSVPVSIASGTRTNDGKTDPSGRLWFGSMDLETRRPIGALYRYDGVSIQTIESDIILSNGLGWSPDRERMYHVDTIASQLYAYRFDLDSGDVSGRRVLVDMSELRGWPDGLAVDVDGNIWVAMYDGWGLNVFDRAGARIHHEALDVARPTSVAFGGDDLDQIYVTTACQELNEEELVAQPNAGEVLRLDPGARGLGVGVFGRPSV